MSLKVKLISVISLFMLMLGVLIMGVVAASTQNIKLEGEINFEVGDKDLYVKSARIKHSTSDDIMALPNFVPGYINGSMVLNVGTITNTSGGFILYFDIVNTTELRYEGNAVYTGSEDVDITTSGTIEAGTSSTVTTDSQPNGIIEVIVSAPDVLNFILSDIKLLIEEIQINVTIETTGGGSVSYSITENGKLRIELTNVPNPLYGLKSLIRLNDNKVLIDTEATKRNDIADILIAEYSSGTYNAFFTSEIYQSLLSQIEWFRDIISDGGVQTFGMTLGMSDFGANRLFYDLDPGDNTKILYCSELYALWVSCLEAVGINIQQPNPDISFPPSVLLIDYMLSVGKNQAFIFEIDFQEGDNFLIEF